MHAGVRAGNTTVPKIQLEEKFDPGSPLGAHKSGNGYTLMSFSYLILDGLEKLGFEIKEHKKEAYLRAWGVIGRILGVLPDLIPANLDEARQLTNRIAHRQISPSDDSREMIRALLKMYQEELQFPIFKSLPAALMRFFLTADLADQLGIPRTRLQTTIRLVAPLQALNRLVKED